MNELRLDEVVGKLRPSFATIVNAIERSHSDAEEHTLYIDQEYKLVVYARDPLGIVLVHLEPHLEGDVWARIRQRGDLGISQPSIHELRSFYHSHMRILCVCAKVSSGYWMNIIVKTRKVAKGTESEAKVVKLEV